MSIPDISLIRPGGEARAIIVGATENSMVAPKEITTSSATIIVKLLASNNTSSQPVVVISPPITSALRPPPRPASQPPSGPAKVDEMLDGSFASPAMVAVSPSPATVQIGAWSRSEKKTDI